MFWRKTSVLAVILAGLLKAGDVNLPDADGTTPLAWAVYNDDLQTAQSLLRAGANPKLANRYGVTPLSLAATNRNATMTERSPESRRRSLTPGSPAASPF